MFSAAVVFAFITVNSVLAQDPETVSYRIGDCEDFLEPLKPPSLLTAKVGQALVQEGAICVIVVESDAGDGELRWETYNNGVSENACGLPQVGSTSPGATVPNTTNVLPVCPGQAIKSPTGGDNGRPYTVLNADPNKAAAGSLFNYNFNTLWTGSWVEFQTKVPITITKFTYWRSNTGSGDPQVFTFQFTDTYKGTDSTWTYVTNPQDGTINFNGQGDITFPYQQSFLFQTDNAPHQYWRWNIISFYGGSSRNGGVRQAEFSCPQQRRFLCGSIYKIYQQDGQSCLKRECDVDECKLEQQDPKLEGTCILGAGKSKIKL